MKNKWVETRITVYDRTVRNRLNEIEFIYRKVNRKPALTHKQKMSLKKATEKQSWRVENWMKMIFNYE